MSFGSASCSRVGFERGKMSGCGVEAAMAAQMSRVKALGCVEVPMRMCGLTALITERRSLGGASPLKSESRRA